MSNIFCGSCGQEMTPENRFCPGCGQENKNAISNAPVENTNNNGISNTPIQNTPIENTNNNGISNTPIQNKPIENTNNNGISNTPIQNTPIENITNNGISNTPIQNTPIENTNSNGISNTPIQNTPIENTNNNGISNTPIQNTPIENSNNNGISNTPIENTNSNGISNTPINNNGGTSNLPLGQNPPSSTTDVDTKVGIIAFGVIAIVVIGIVFAIIVNFSSPDSVAKKFINATYEFDAESVIDLAYPKSKDAFLDYYNTNEKDFIESMNDIYEYAADVIAEKLDVSTKKLTNYMEITDIEEKSLSEREKDAIIELNEKYVDGIKIKDAKIMIAEVEFEYKDISSDFELEIQLIKVGSKWYFDILS